MVLSEQEVNDHQDGNDYSACVLELTTEERARIEMSLEDLPPIDLANLDDDLLITEIEVRASRIPERLIRLLSDFRKNSNEYGMLLIRNLPIDADLPPTPPDGKISPLKTTPISECVLLELMLHLGDPIAYADEKDGAMIQNICPVQGKQEAQENTGAVYLEFHTEDAFHPHKPDYVTLLCLRPDHEGIAATAAASIRRALHMVPTKAQELLRRPLYRIRLSASFMSDENDEPLFSPPMPVLSQDLLEPEMSVDFYGMEAIDPAAQTALKTLETVLSSVAVEHRLVPGDMLIVDNRVAAHARTAFAPRGDGQDRWLQRIFAVRDFRKSRASRARGSHVCTPLPIELINVTNPDITG